MHYALGVEVLQAADEVAHDCDGLGAAEFVLVLYEVEELAALDEL